MNSAPSFSTFCAMLLATVVITFGHPGRTDADGGHTDGRTGQYHYHNGRPARMASPVVPAQIRPQSEERAGAAEAAGVLTVEPNPSARSTSPSRNPSISEWRLQRLKERAESGDPDSQFELGERHMKGDGVQKDVEKGRELLTKAAKAGHAAADKLLRSPPPPLTSAPNNTELLKRREAEKAKNHQAPGQRLTAEQSARWLANSEQSIRMHQTEAAAEALNRILREAPGSHEARIVVGLVRLLRQDGATPYTGSVTAVTLQDVSGLKKHLENFENIARNYRTTTEEKRKALDTIFGYGTFSKPNLGLEGLLNATAQMEASRQKALRGY